MGYVTIIFCASQFVFTPGVFLPSSFVFFFSCSLVVVLSPFLLFLHSTLGPFFW